MPRHGPRYYLLQDLKAMLVASLADAEEVDEEEVMNWILLLEGVKDQRYLTAREGIPKSTWATTILPDLSDTRFRKFIRMDRASFRHVVALIRNDPIFQNNSSYAQAPVEAQLQYALWKLGQNGTASGNVPSATFWGVSEGHVVDCTKRVILALRHLRETFVKWSNSKQRRLESLQNDDREGFIGCIGKVDGTDIVLEYKPGGVYEGEQFFSRKKRYALDLCAVCNSKKEFTYMLAGWPNSKHDATVWASTSIFRSPSDFFGEGQYLLGDAAYSVSTRLIPPYKAPHTQQSENRRFNRKLSNVRVDIEHAFGILKGRWASLAGLRIKLRIKKSYMLAVF